MHRGYRPTAAVTAQRTPAWRTALSLFTILPVGGGAELSEDQAARAVRWLPAVGLLLGLAGAAVIVGVGAGGSSGPQRLLGAALAVALLALLTGGLHLDGLLDAWRSTRRQVVAVSNEVGSGVVPGTASGVRFRDELGVLNARIAAECEQVWLCTSGIARRLR